MKKQLTITTSWDDGSYLDMRLGGLLTKYGLKGTFYVPDDFGKTTGKFSAYKRRLNEEELRALSVGHEIGGHTVHHKSLIGLPREEVLREMIDNKVYLEQIIGKEVKMFAYPNGLFDAQTTRLAREAGFAGARTTGKLHFSQNFDKFLTPVSVMAAPFPLRKLDAHRIYWRRALDPLRGYGLSLLAHPRMLVRAYSWQAFARAAVAEAHASGGYFHLYGHSWEIEAYDFWSELEEFFKYLQYENTTGN